jgi:outer membrane protein
MTRKLVTLFFVVVAMSLVATAQTAAPSAAPAPAPAPAPAAPAPAPAGGQKIGIINIQQAIMATNEGQRDFQALEKKFEPKRTELTNANNEIENLTKKLNDQGAKLNEAARKELVTELENKKKSLNRSYEDAQSAWNDQQNDIANRIGTKLLEVLEKYANDNGYAVILDVGGQQSPVLWASAATNITKAVVDAYNAQSNVAAPPPPAPAPRTATPTPKAATPSAATKPAPSTAPAKKP